MCVVPTGKAHTLEYSVPTGGPIWEGLRGVVLLEEVCYWKQVFPTTALCLVVVDRDTNLNCSLHSAIMDPNPLKLQAKLNTFVSKLSCSRDFNHSHRKVTKTLGQY